MAAFEVRPRITYKDLLDLVMHHHFLANLRSDRDGYRTSISFSLALLEDSVSLSNLLLEVDLIGEQFFVIDSGLVQDHTGDGRSFLFTVSLEDGGVNVVTNEVVTLFTLQVIKGSDVYLRQPQLLGLLWHSLTSHVLLLLIVHLRLLVTSVRLSLIVVAVSTTVVVITATIASVISTIVSTTTLVVILVATTVAAMIVVILALLASITVLLRSSRLGTTHHVLGHHTRAWLHWWVWHTVLRLHSL